MFSSKRQSDLKLLKEAILRTYDEAGDGGSNIVPVGSHPTLTL